MSDLIYPMFGSMVGDLLGPIVGGDQSDDIPGNAYREPMSVGDGGYWFTLGDYYTEPSP